jgi:site-specific recombinase XerD
MTLPRDWIAHATNQVSTGMDILTIRKPLGHSNVKTTTLYAHLAPSHRAAEMERYQQYMAVG